MKRTQDQPASFKMNNSSYTVQPNVQLKPVWIIAYSITAVAIVTANSLTIASFRRLPVAKRARAHIFLINLAVADLLVGFLAIPMYLLYLASLVSNYPFVIVDMTLGLASIFTLTIIALERLYAIFRPFQLRQIPAKTYLKSVLLLWVATALPVMFLVLNEQGLLISSAFHAIIVASLFAPLSVTCLAYLCLWMKVKLRPFPGEHAKQDRRLATTLLITTVIFLAAWIPYSVLSTLVYYHPSVVYSRLLVHGIKLLQYSNSFMNPIIYCFRIPDFRRVMSSIVSCRKSQRNQVDMNMIRLNQPIRTSLVTSNAFNLSLHQEELHVRNNLMLSGVAKSTLDSVQCVKIIKRELENVAEISNAAFSYVNYTVD